MYPSLLNSSTGLFSDLERLQRQLQQAFGVPGAAGSIRAVASGAFPAINVGTTSGTIEIYAFAPGIDPASIDVQVDRGVLSIAGERKPPERNGEDGGKGSVYANERFAGRFRRTVNLPDDADPARVEARYRDGVLHVTVMRRESTQPRRIEVQ